MRGNLLFVALGLVFSVMLDGAGRAPKWRVEAVPGAYRLSLEEISLLSLPLDAGERLRSAAKDFLFVAEERAREFSIVESSRPKRAIVLELDTIGSTVAGAYSIYRERSRVFLKARTEEGLANGLYAIAHEWFGARWYWPDEIGRELTAQVFSKVPEGLWRESPKFVMRSMRPCSIAFSRQNRLHPRWNISHNLALVFGRDLYMREPRVFPVINGQRVIPKGSRRTDAQPDFLNPRTVEIAAEAAIAHFENESNSRSFSLSINDNVRFDESVRTEGTVSPLQYFRQRPDYTNLVFCFMNSVAERLDAYDAKRKAEGGKRKAESGKGEADGAWQRGDGESERFARSEAKCSEAGCPLGERGANRKGESGNLDEKDDWRSIWETASGESRYLTALAYYWTEQSPTIPIHPRVMPVLTSDRAQWHDPDYRVEDRALIERWVDSGAERIATWDYYFGAPYPYPRQFNQWIDESLKHLSAQGVDVFYSQLPSVWGLDGPKAWLAAQLLWDPEQDSGELLDEFYTNFFGPAAGPIRGFYELAESHRNANEGKADWIKFYKDEAGIDMMLPVLPRLRACIDQAEALVESGSRFAERVKVVSDAFRFTELYAAYHESRLLLVAECFVGAVALESLEAYLSARVRFLDYAEQLVQEPLHSELRRFTDIGQSDPALLALGLLEKPSQEDRYLALQEISNALAPDGKSLLENEQLEHAPGKWRERSFLGPRLPTVSVRAASPAWTP